MTPQSEDDPKPLYELVRRQIEHEDSLITQRLSWLIASQSFLFTAYAITLNAAPQGRSRAFVHQQDILTILVPLVAAAISLLIFVPIVGGKIAMQRLVRRFTETAGNRLPADYPPIQGSTLTRLLGISAPMLLPLLFIAVWIYLVMEGAR